MKDLSESIVMTATRLFEQYGIRSVSIDNVCNEIRISKKTFYTCFPQKEDLVDAVLDYQKKYNYDKFAKLLKDKNAIESLVLIIKEVKKKIDSESTTMCYDLEKYYPKVYERHEQRKYEEIRIGFEHNLRQGISEGFYRQDLDVEMTSLFHSVQVKSTFALMQQASKKYSKKQLFDFFIDLIIHLIASEKGLEYMKENSLTF
ncbi:MAG TPA: TetR/AcrR family transcriptional regulator [Paludibacter sp.]|nr:TetR/AcrR family transcriptional regulator [Paludibacter sp.]